MEYLPEKARHLDVSAQHTPPLTRAASATSCFSEEPHHDELHELFPENSFSSITKIQGVPKISDPCTTQAGNDPTIQIEQIIGDSTSPSSYEAETKIVPRAVEFLTLSNEYDEDKLEERFEYFVPRGRLPRRRALLIAIRDIGSPEYSVLSGPHQDAGQVKSLLQDTFGWPSGCFTVLKDDRTSAKQPTKKNILSAIDHLVKDAKKDDHLFLYFAGHGTQVDDIDGDEIDKEDEVLLTCDNKYIVDDDLHTRLAKRVPAGCRLTVLFDCCSSGTGLDLQFNKYTNPTPKKAKCAGFEKICPGNIVLLAACEDGDIANESYSQAPVRGMFTREVINFLRERRQGTIRDLLYTVRKRLNAAGGVCRNQYPQLSSSRPIDSILDTTLHL